MSRFKVLIVGPTMVDRTLFEMYVDDTFGRGVPAYSQFSSAQDAWPSIVQERFDLAIMDASLLSKGYDRKGMDLVKNLRKSALNGNIAVIGYSSNDTYEEPMLEAGADVFIYKHTGDDSETTFADKAFEALFKAADRDPKTYIALFRQMGIISNEDIQGKV